MAGGRLNISVFDTVWKLPPSRRRERTSGLRSVAVIFRSRVEGFGCPRGVGQDLVFLRDRDRIWVSNIYQLAGKGPR